MDTVGKKITAGVVITALLAAATYPLVKSKKETRTMSTVQTPKTQKFNHDEFDQCDCKPLWECMQSGGDCTQLEKDLRNCVNRVKSQLARK
ncbi:hypothetical protein M0811_08388 [Anaeramoeba ignava]|uniref:Uncharacterized protein n=1 Tax=Anaeramoeba ignava TaxID=1746090 RepID=A0A9Q0RB73_ANAIG|nr:hypothetical protein M0811_08388 [Anaeramoeba ignava]